MSFNFSRTTEARGNRVREGDRNVKRSCENNSKYSSHDCALINARKNENFFRKCHHHDSWVAPIYHHHSRFKKRKLRTTTEAERGERGSGGATSLGQFSWYLHSADTQLRWRGYRIKDDNRPNSTSQSGKREIQMHWLCFGKSKRILNIKE